MSSMIHKNPAATTKWRNPPFPAGREPTKLSLPALTTRLALAVMVLIHSPFFAVAVPITRSHVNTPKPVDGGSGGGKALDLLHDQLGAQGQDNYPDLGDSGGGEKLTHLYLKDPPIIKDGVMEKAIMHAMNWDSDDGVEEDGHEHVSPTTLPKAEIKNYMTEKGVSKSLDNEGLGETLKAGKNNGGLKKPFDDGVDKALDKINSPGVTTEGTNIEVSTDRLEQKGLASTSSFPLQEGMRRLKRLNRGGLRGSSDVDSAAAITEVKDILELHLDSMQSIQKNLQDGDKEGAGFALKSMVDDVDSLVEVGEEGKVIDSTSVGGNSLGMNDIPNGQLVQFIQPQVFDEIVDHAQTLRKILKGIDLSVFPTPPSHEHLKTKGFRRDDTFIFESDPFGSGSAGGGHQSIPNGNFHPNNFFKNPSLVKNLLNRHKASNGGDFSTPNLSKFTNFHNDNLIMAKHQIRLDALGDTCAPRCGLEDSSCNCQRLFECVADMTEYDLAVLVAGGFIDTNPPSNTYGAFTVPVEQLNLYNADQGVSAKLVDIKAKAVDNNIGNLTKCTEVLQELFSACNPNESTCTNPNVQSFAVSTEQVCNAVNTPIKLLFEAIGDEFDGFVDKFAKSNCEPLSYDICAQFVVEFDKLYDGRNIDKYPLTNPMLILPNNTVHDQVDNEEVFRHIQFPVRYNFLQDQHSGVVDRTFGPSPDGDSFFLVNPTSGKVLGRKDDSCTNKTPIEVQDRIYGVGSDHQQFFLTDDGRLKNKGCSNDNGMLTNKWNVDVESCLKATTGNGPTDGGHLFVYVDSGNGFALVTDPIIYAKGSVVFYQCFQNIVGIQVSNPTGSAWRGYIENSFDGGITWAGVRCQDCEGTTDTMPVIVDGNGDSGSLEGTHCWKGNTCTMAVDNNNGDLGICNESCRDGNELVIQDEVSGSNADLQRWTFQNKDQSIINKKCGHWKGKLTISAIDDDAIIKIDYTDTIPIQFVNPESNLALGLERGRSCTNGRNVESQDRVENDSDQTFYVKRTTDGSGNWKIYSKECSGMLLEIKDGSCKSKAEIQLFDEFLGDPLIGMCLDASGNPYEGVYKNEQKNCFDFCRSLPGFEDQVGMEVSSNCICYYGAGTLPPTGNLPSGAKIGRFTNVRKVRVELEGTNFLNLAEVQVFDYGNVNRALNKVATQSSTYSHYDASKGNNDDLNDYMHTNYEEGASWQVDLMVDTEVNKVKIYNRSGQKERLSDSVVSLLDHTNTVLATSKIGDASMLIEIPSTDFKWKSDPGSGQVKSGDPDFTGTCRPYIIDKRNEWKINDGKVESAKCEDMVMEIEDTATKLVGSSIVLAPNNDRGWNQGWSVKSNVARLLTDSGDSSQEWKAIFVQPNYDYALLPGFLGTLHYNVRKVRVQRKRTHDLDLREVQVFDDENVNWALDKIATQSSDRDSLHLTSKAVNGDLTETDYSQTKYDEGAWWEVDLEQDVVVDHVRIYVPPRSILCQTVVSLLDHKEKVLATYEIGDAFSSQIEIPSTDFSCTTRDKGLAKSAMYSCDESMALLLGSTTSVGTLRAIADLTNDPEKGSEYMPGECCMDVATNSDFFGYRYDPTLENKSTGQKMECQHRGPWHLGVSEEACENAGGEWYRTPCMTLRDCIDDRPSRFALEAPPSDGSCQQTMEKLNTAFVSSSTAHDNFNFNATMDGCFHFCRNLTDYPLQIGMEVEGLDSDNDIVDTCMCLYNNGQVPSKELLPEYVNRSPPKFSLKDAATGKLALGLRHKSDCNADEISVEFQTYNGRPRQEFQLTPDNRIVSTLCPERVLTAAGAGDGARLVASAPDFNEVDTSLHQPQQWKFNDDGSISNVALPSPKVAAIKDATKLVSFYFALENPKTHLAMGATGSADDCQDGMKIALQESVYGSPNIQFYVIGSSTTVNGENGTISSVGNGTITNVMCPQLAISIPNNDCEASEELHLSSEGGTWQLKKDGTIESIECPGMFIDIDNGALSTGSTATAPHPNLLSIFKFNTNLPGFNNESNYETANRTNFTEAQIPTWDETVLPEVGAAIAVSKRSSQKYQKWKMNFQQFKSLMGPFSFVNPMNGIAFGTEEGPCAHNMVLEAQSDDYSSLHQKFYLGKHGSIFSPACPGLVISMESLDDDCSSTAGQSLRLRTFTNNDIQMKWKLNDNGSIESVKCQGMVIGSAFLSNTPTSAVTTLSLKSPTSLTATISTSIISSDMILQNRDTDNSSQIWRRQNVRLSARGTSSEHWIQDWAISFVEPGYNISNLEESSGVLMCYPPNPAFNRAFEDFTKDFVINNAAVEDQCRNAREEMGFEPDHPFDTEVCQKFKDHMCDHFFTGIDHLTGPPKFEHVEYEEVEYEEVEYKEVEYEEVEYEFEEYSDDDVLPFNGLDNHEDTHLTNEEELQTEKGGLRDLEKTKQILHHTKGTLGHLNTFVIDLGNSICSLTGGENICFIFCFLNPLRVVCDGVMGELERILNILIVIADIAFEVVNSECEKGTLGAEDAIFGYEYSKATYKDLQAHNSWNYNALTNINQNIQSQHIGMRQHLQDRHSAMEKNIGEDIGESRNALGQAIISSQNAIGEALVDSQNANGQLIVDAQNANGQAIVDARNAMSDQHNAMVEWLHTNLCALCVGFDCACAKFIGPLEDDQTHIPLHLHWPEGQVTLMEKLNQIEMKGDSVEEDIQRALGTGEDGARSLPSIGMETEALTKIRVQVDAIEGNMKVFEGTMQAVKAETKQMKDITEGNMKEVKDKVDAQSAETKEMKDMMSQLIEQNTKLMQLMEHKNTKNGPLVEDYSNF